MSVDSSNLISNQNSVTQDMLYNLKPSAGTSRRYRVNIPASNGQSFAPGTQMNFSIPCNRARTYLDGQNSYLRLTVKNNDGTNTMNIDDTAACFINMITINHSGNLIDMVPNYGLLFNYIFDFTYSLSDRIGFLSSYLGTAPFMASTGDVVLAVAGSSVNGLSAGTTIGSMKGESFSFSRGGMPIAAGGQQTFCIPLICSLFLNSDKYIPIGKLKSDIEFIVTLESLIRSVALYSGTTSWSIINAELCLEIVELSETSQAYVDQYANPNIPMYIHSNQWRYFSNTIPSGSVGNYTCLISARYNSLKSLVLLPQLTSDTTTQNSYSLSSRINPNIINYSWRLGQTVVPSKPVQLFNNNTTGGFSEGYIEVLKNFHTYNTVSGYRPAIGAAEYNVWDDATDNLRGVYGKGTGNSTYQNGFCIAAELEVFNSRSDTIIQGLNMSAQNCYFDCNLSTTGLTASYLLNFFANFDVILTIENGVMRTVL